MESAIRTCLAFMLIELAVESAQGLPGIKFRLSTFDAEANDGVAEIFYNGSWGAIDIRLQDISYDFSAKALCNTMGFGYVGFTTKNTYHSASGLTMLTWITDFSCKSNYSNATECIDENTLVLRNINISSILHCYAFEITEVRLTGGVVPSEGLLEVRISNRWAAVMDGLTANSKDAFDDMICRTLGYVEESVIQPAKHGSPYAIMKIKCQSNVSSVYDITRQCDTQTVWLPPMAYDIYKAINCQPIRLINGPSSLEGRVEAGLFNQLRTICGLGFDEYAANVTCTSLGYRGLAHFNLKTIYEFGHLPLYSKQISCSGKELSLEHCNHSIDDIPECGEDDAVSVACIGGEMKLEVFNKTRPYEGLFTASYGGYWYDVLGNVSIKTAQNLCSMLGFGNVGFPALLRNGKSIDYYKSNIACLGNESHIDECFGDLLYCAIKGQDNCYRVSQMNDGLLALFCSEYQIQHLTIVDSVVVLTINNETWSICKTNFSSDTADSVCRILGYVGHVRSWSAPVESRDNAVIGYLICEHRAMNLTQCKIRHQYYHRLYAPEFACSDKIGVVCETECRQGFFGTTCTKCLCESENTHSCNILTGECFCKQDWTGVTCSDDLDECQIDTDNCKVPSLCVNIDGSFVCQCPEGTQMKNTSDGGRCEDIIAINFRLQTFDDQANDGIPEMFYNGSWAAVTIPIFSIYSDFSAKALCNSIGFGYDGFFTWNIYHYASSNIVLTWTTDFACTSNHSNATECIDRKSLSLRNTTVTSILHCYAFEITDIRLRGGALPSEGVLEAKISNRWGAVRYLSKYNAKDALDDMICRTLGYTEESVIQPTKHGNPYVIITILSCPNNISSVFDITRQCSTEKGVRYMDYGYSLKEINCQPIRLVDGPSALEGRVEAGLFRKLYTICGLGFDTYAANVTCRSLGYSGMAHFNSKTIYGTGNLPLYSRNISCSGQELTLEHCNHSDSDIEACGQNDVVNLACIGGPMKMEVFNETRPYEGLLKAYYGGNMYDVLGNVSLATARNLCSMLGFGNVGFSTLSRYGKFLEYYKTNVSCNGNESHIDECSGDLQYCANKVQDNCFMESLGTLLALFCSDYDIQKVALESQKVELTINNETWSVCEDFFTPDAADSVCRILGYSGSTSVTPAPVNDRDKTTIGSLLCEPGALTLKGCKIKHQYSNGIYAEGQACSNNIAITCKNVVRLIDGPSSLEGRIETVLFGHNWTICGLGFNKEAAKVACTSLGYSELSNFYLKTAYGVGNLSLYSKNISCTGKELTLEECVHSYTDNEACSNNDVVGVACKGGQLKLERFNEARRYEGVLSTYHDGHWFDILRPVSNVTARTLCLMLGFGAVGFSAPARYGKNVYRFKTNISCNGNEKHIDECSGLMQYCIARGDNCIQMSRTAGLLTLFCSDYDIQSIALLAGVVELRINNESWSVCDDYFTDDTADSVCRILGYTGSTLFRSAPVQDGESEVIGNLLCDSGAVTLSQCKLKHQYSYRPYVSGSECSKRIEIVCKNECRQGYFGLDCSQCLCTSVNTQSCNNVTGECTCKHGWSGATCSDDVNECLAATDICKDPSVCVNTAGSYFCQCPIGMYMKETSCQVCTNNTHGLNCLETCSCSTMNTNASDQMCDPKTGKCFCKPEWTGNACDNDINECLSPTSYRCLENNTACVNEEGGYKCDCIEDFKRENGICVPVTSPAKADGLSSLTITAIASSAGGSIIIIIVVIAVAVACVRRHKGKAEGYKNENKEKHWQQRSVENTEGTDNGETDHYIVLDGFNRDNSPYQKLKHEDDAKNGYIELSKCLNDNYDVLDDAKIQKLRSEDMVSDGYFTPNCGKNDDKYVSSGYLKPISKDNRNEGDYLKPQRTYQRASDDYLRI